jgi:hypothetical protein
MNSTYIEEEMDYETKEVCIDYIISLATISSLFVVSEVLPFLKSQKGNGLVDLLICLFSGSECMLSKLIECLKGDEGDKGQQQTQEQEQEQALNNTTTQQVNININENKNNDI